MGRSSVVQLRFRPDFGHLTEHLPSSFRFLVGTGIGLHQRHLNISRDMREPYAHCALRPPKGIAFPLDERDFPQSAGFLVNFAILGPKCAEPASLSVHRHNFTHWPSRVRPAQGFSLVLKPECWASTTKGRWYFRNGGVFQSCSHH